MSDEVLRQEKKFLMTIDKAYKLRHKLGEVLHKDENGGVNGYMIRSLYFDSLEERDFDEKLAGIESRRKIRLRNYGPDTDFAKLEMKQKQGMMQKKRSLKMSKDDALEMIYGNYSVLMRYSDPFAIECYSVMNMFCYRPKAVITYSRLPFVVKENKIRLTFDSDIRGTESFYDIFSRELTEVPLFDPYIVLLEVKFNGFLLSYIRDLLNTLDTSEVSLSKYCLGRKSTLDYVY